MKIQLQCLSFAVRFSQRSKPLHSDSVASVGHCSYVRRRNSVEIDCHPDWPSPPVPSGVLQRRFSKGEYANKGGDKPKNLSNGSAVYCPNDRLEKYSNFLGVTHS